jgi:hypothetical protein
MPVLVNPSQLELPRVPEDDTCTVFGTDAYLAKMADLKLKGMVVILQEMVPKHNAGWKLHWIKRRQNNER